MNGKMLILFVAFLFVIPFSLAQSNFNSNSGVLSPEAVSTRFIGEVQQDYMDKSISYIKEKLGNGYYGEYISFSSGESYEDCFSDGCIIRNEVSFDYKVPSEFSSNSRGSINIRITLDKDGKIVNYFGPVKSYQFLTSKDEILTLARNYGLVKLIDAEIVMSNLEKEGYEIIWAVSSEDLLEYGEFAKEPIYKGIYVGIESGNILGEYKINSMIQTPSGSSGIVLGQFFDEFKSDDSQENKFTVFWIIGSIIIAVLVLTFVFYRVFRK